MADVACVNTDCSEYGVPKENPMEYPSLRCGDCGGATAPVDEAGDLELPDPDDDAGALERDDYTDESGPDASQ